MKFLRKTAMRSNLVTLIAVVAAILVLSSGAAVATAMIGSPQIIDGSVKAVDLGAGAVKTAKSAGSAVNSAKIANGSIVAADLANSAVNSAAILNGSVTGTDIANNAINAAKILDNSITGADIADNSIGAAKINRSGLDADLLDGVDSSGYVKKSGDSDVSGQLTASAYNYAAPKTEYLSINVSAFNPERSGVTFGGRTFGRLYATGSGTSRWQAPVQLPHGATVKSVRFRLFDNYAPEDHEASMQRTNSGGLGELLAYIPTPDTTASWQLLTDDTINLAVIDNQAYDYIVAVSLYGEADQDLMAGQVMITYEVNAP